MRLLSTPYFYEPVQLKASFTGVTYLKTDSFKKRYLGSKTYDVNPMGILQKKSPRKIEGGTRNTRLNSKVNTNTDSNKKSFEAETKTRYYTINKKEVRTRINTFVQSMPRNQKHLYFWSVSFPYKISDSLAYDLLNIWLTKLRQKALIKHYIWVAERQKNGTIHFHLAIPHIMNVEDANNEMKICLLNAANKGKLNEPKSKLSRYNGVDIAKKKIKVGGKWIRTKKVLNFASRNCRKSLLRYLTKYVTKNETKFERFAWHNSRSFSSLFTGISFTIDEFVNVYGFKKYLKKTSYCSNEFYQFHVWISDPPPNLVGEFIKINSFVFNN